MLTATATHAQQRANAQHYDESCDFMGMCTGDDFDEQVETELVWMGFVRNDDGMLELVGEYIYDGAGLDSGMGWLCC